MPTSHCPSTSPPSIAPNEDSTFCHPDVEFITEKDPEIKTPDNSSIRSKTEQYYPFLVGKFAPPSKDALKCTTSGCGLYQCTFYACKSCLRTRWYCKECLVHNHRELPFHCVVGWDTDKGCLIDETLSNLGLIVHLDHDNGTACNSTPRIDKERVLEVLHVNGMHNLRYYQCTCNKSSSQPRSASAEQLLINNLFPATDKNPQWAFSFETLETYDALDLSGYINIKQYLDGIMELGGIKRGEDVSCTSEDESILNLRCSPEEDLEIIFTRL